MADRRGRHRFAVGGRMTLSGFSGMHVGVGERTQEKKSRCGADVGAAVSELMSV